ncbi:MAG TPA: hypothetical protein VFE21_03500 [Rubrobacteraceae bacterium]|nr:hypothetical protein [Rubrobacteraceae bacterium]
MLLTLIRSLVRWSMLLCIPGGVLWALSPLGVYLSEYRYSTPAVFWKLFPSAVLLMTVGMIGLWFWTSAPGWLERVGLVVVLVGLLMVVAGNVGKYWLGVDDVYLMTAPAYKAFRLGLVVLAVGSALYGAASARNRSLPVWAALPFAIAALAGLISVLQDFGYLGAGMWILFGVGWAWVGFSLLVVTAFSAWRKRRAR